MPDRFFGRSALAPAAFTFCLMAPVSPALAQSSADQTATPPQRPGFFDIFNFETLTTSLTNTLMTTARAFADIRYDQISFDPLAMRLTVVGLDVRPFMPGPDPDACVVTAGRLSLAGQPLDRPDGSRLRASLDDVNVGLGCLPPQARGAVYGLGLQQVLVPRADLNLLYDYASGGVVADLSLDLDSLSAIEAHIVADYVSFRIDMETEEPQLAVDLTSAQVTVDDKGGWAIASRVIPQNMQAPEALQQIVAGGLAAALTEMNGLNAPQLSEAQQQFAAQAGAVARSVAEGAQRAVLATNIAQPPFRISEASVQDVTALFDALAPSISQHAPQLDRVIPLAEMQAALNSESTPDNAHEIGKALLTGIGAPRNTARGLSLLAAASRKGDAEAAFLVAEALADSAPETAYGHALRAAAGGISGALAVLDRAERGSGFAHIIELQNDARPGGPEPELYDSVIGMRQAARAYINGVGNYRSYRAAYYWASMAAAAGDSSGAAMRDEIDELMRHRGDADAWAEEAKSLENGVLRDWIAKDLPTRLQ